jgi:hypothetical protein
LNRRVRHLGMAIFLVSISGAMLQLMYSIRPAWFDLHLGRGTLLNISGIALEFSIVGAAVAAFAAQEGFAKLAQDSETTALHLNDLAIEVEKTPLAGIALRQRAEQSIEEMRLEHEDWYLLYSLRGIEYSG